MATFDLVQIAIENDDDELVYMLLSEYKPPKGPTYDPTWPRFDLAALTAEQCKTNFRFEAADIRTLASRLRLPPVITLANGSTCDRVDAMCILLRRLSYPNRLSDIEPMFGRPQSTLSLIISSTVESIWDRHHHRLASLDQPWLLRNLQSFADAIHDKGAPLENCFGFIDGTVRPICRPTRHQRVVYNGHKRVHSLKFQSVVTPNGMIANLFGPVEGRRHDSAVVRMSGLMAELEHRQMRDRAGRAMAVYGDPAYPLREYLQCPFKGANITPGQQDFNAQMASARECVEWEFGKMLRIFAFLDFRKNLKIFLSPVAKYYLVGGILTNCHTCLYGSQTCQYFGLEPPTLAEYLA